MKKVLSFGTCLALGLSVVGASSALAEEATFYFDNSTTNWDSVCVWAWSEQDGLWASGIGFDAWPGIELEKDAATGYYVYVCEDYVEDGRIMFNNHDNGEQTCDAVAQSAAAGKVCVPTVKNTADDEAADPLRKADQWYGEWQDVAAAEAPAEAPAAEEPAAEAPAAEAPAAEEPAAEAPAAEAPAAEAPAADAGKTADATPIAAVAMLGLVSMAVVVATRKKIA